MNYPIPLEFLLKTLCETGQVALWRWPELTEFLLSHEARDTLYYIEHTTAAKGPYVLYYPLSAWADEQERQAELDRLIAQQEIDMAAAKERNRDETLRLITLAKRRGDMDEIKRLRKLL